MLWGIGVYKHVLLAYDGSLEGAQALREGALLARSCGSQVTLLCVIPDSPGARMAEGIFAGALGSQVDEYRDLLESAVGVLKQMGFQPESRLLMGEPSPVIAAVAKEIKADLIVVGHHTEGMLTRWWQGSSETFLCDHCHCSLLIGNARMSDEEFQAAIGDRVSA